MSLISDLKAKYLAAQQKYIEVQKAEEFVKTCAPKNRVETAVVTGAGALATGMDIADGASVVGAVVTGAFVAGVACLGLGVYRLASDMITEKAGDMAKAHIEQLSKNN